MPEVRHACPQCGLVPPADPNCTICGGAGSISDEQMVRLQKVLERGRPL